MEVKRLRDVQEDKTCSQCGDVGRKVRIVNPWGEELEPWRCLGKGCYATTPEPSEAA